MTIVDRLAQVHAIIAAACQRAGRSPADVRLVAVSKTHPPALILEAIQAGAQHLGENRVEEAESKIPAVRSLTSQAVTWHMVGHIQSRKARDVAAFFDWVHSVDSLKLASKLSVSSVQQGRKLPVLLEVNVSGEESKYGFQAAGWEHNSALRDALCREVEQIAALPGLDVRGFMTMAPIVPAMEQTRPVFASLRGLRDTLSRSLGLSFPDLSMGMTDDYPVAIEEGATIVRIGRAIFGEREK
jgi:hypothetical protein